MKYEIGDKILVLLTDEEGTVVDIMNEKMVMIDVKGTKFPIYTDQIDFPYFKMFTQQRKEEKKKVFLDNIPSDKKGKDPFKDEGMFLSFIPVFEKDVFDDAVVERLKIYLVSKMNTAFNFTYVLSYGGRDDFELKNTIMPGEDFYLHDIEFEKVSDNPKFDFEFSLVKPDKNKMLYYETSLKFKAKQFFKKLDEMQQKNEPVFSNLLFTEYPGKVEEVKVDLSKFSNTHYRIYDASRARENMEQFRSVVDLHIEQLATNWKHLSNFEILTIQLRTFEKYFDLAIAHHQPSFIVIHGIGAGKLKEEIHQILLSKKEVKLFENKYHPSFGYGATEIFLK